MTDPQNRHYNASGLHALTSFFANSFNFTGKSSRNEFWWLTLISLVLIILPIPIFAPLLQGLLWGTAWLLASGALVKLPADAMIALWPVLIPIALGIALLVPVTALFVRRYRDAGLHWSVYVIAVGLELGWLIYFFERPQDLAVVWLPTVAIVWGLAALPTKPACPNSAAPSPAAQPH